jgi:phosphatidylinositol alpha-1,6-mannosyltransferase
MSHVLITNDFPPKVGGIQSYLYELWRRLDPESFSVLTSAHSGAQAFDLSQPFRIERMELPALIPGTGLLRPKWSVLARARKLIEEQKASLAVIDPALPLGLLGPMLGVPYAVVVHGAELAIPARLPATREALAWVLKRSALIVAAGPYPAKESKVLLGAREVPIVDVPPGVDTEVFKPLGQKARMDVRARLGLPLSGPLVVSVSRLVARKGMDTLIEASRLLAGKWPELTVVIGGKGREFGNLQAQVARTKAPVVMLGAVPQGLLPGLYASGDVFVMACRDRWFGLEREGFGIVFLEAAACGVPQVAGRSGGSVDAVVDGETGFVLKDPRNPGELAEKIDVLLSDQERRTRMGMAARKRAVEEYDYDELAPILSAALLEVKG